MLSPSNRVPWVRKSRKRNKNCLRDNKKTVSMLKEDRVLSEDVEKIRQIVKKGQIP